MKNAYMVESLAATEMLSSGANMKICFLKFWKTFQETLLATKIEIGNLRQFTQITKDKMRPVTSRYTQNEFLALFLQIA